MNARENANGDLRGQLVGTVLSPDDEEYEEARAIFNSMIDRRPAVIAQCANADDVVAAIAFARERDLEIAIRSGGHSVAGAGISDGGLVVDVRNMNAVEVDPAARTATVAGGATWGDFDRATQAHGLAATGGRISTTGVAGLTLGGGSGWLERKFGLACDNLLEVELVTAQGRSAVASEDENPELFWALHGGGGNFGVATRLVFGLHELPAASLALMLWSPEAGPVVLRAFRDLIESGAPEELGGGVNILTGPPAEFVPQHLQGKQVVAALAAYAGPEGEMREVIAPLHGLEPEGELVAEMPYAEIQCAFDHEPGHRNYWSAEHLAELPEAAIEAFCARAADEVVPSFSEQFIAPWGGAVAREAGRWPLPHRSASWVVHPFGEWEDAADDQRAIAWARDLRADMEPWATGAVYLNFVGDEGDERVLAGYGAENQDRLGAVKAEFDPDEVFHLHHNIKPLAAA